jgi:hypothetical protein
MEHLLKGALIRQPYMQVDKLSLPKNHGIAFYLLGEVVAAACTKPTICTKLHPPDVALDTACLSGVCIWDSVLP